MKKIRTILVYLIIATCYNSIAQFNDTLKIDYFGQTPPGNVPVIFAPDLISTPHSFVQNGTFSLDGKRFVYVITDSAWSKSKVMFMSNLNGKWTKPISLNIPRERIWTPFFSVDGKDIYFASPTVEKNTGHIFVIHQTLNGWSDPVRLKSPINSDFVEPDFCLAPNGTMYFTSGRPEGYGESDIFSSKLENG